MKVIRTGQARTFRGESHFTGDVTLTRLLTPDQADGSVVDVVRFRNGARTHWHAHPGGQILVILEGEGRIATDAEEQPLQAGDVVYAQPGERHWHGAAPDALLTHLSISIGGEPDWFGPPE